MNHALLTAIPCGKYAKKDKAIYLNTIKDNTRKDKNQKQNATKTYQLQASLLISLLSGLNKHHPVFIRKP